MTDTNSTTAAPLNADPGLSEASGPTSGAPAQPSNPENAENKAEAGASLSPQPDDRLIGLVSQDLYDALKHELDALKQDYASAHAAFKMASLDRDETKAYAANLAEQLVAAEQKLAAAGVTTTTTALKHSYATEEDERAALEAEIENIKKRVHAGLDEAKALASRLADIVPMGHPGRALEGTLTFLKAKASELL